MAINQENVVEMQQIKFDLFKTQNPEIGRFDVTFEFGGKLLYAHKLMLNLVSDTFDSMLADRWNTNKDEPIKIKDYSYDDFYQFIVFLYSGQCELNDSNISSMVDIAEFYGVPLFKNYCDQYLSDMDVTAENIFQFIELAQKYSLIQLQTTVHEYITVNFQSFMDSDGFLNLKKLALQELVFSVNEKVEPEDLFLAVYKWSEKRSIDKQAIEPHLNLHDTIKAEFSDFLHHIDFRRMELNFLHEFVVPKGFIFPSLDQLSEILCDRHPKTKVTITNSREQTLHGSFVPDKFFSEHVDRLLKPISNACFRDYFSWFTECKIPSTQSRLKKRDGIEWYLMYKACGYSVGNGDIGVKHCSLIEENDYLLAEMTVGTSGFQAVYNSKSNLNNVLPFFCFCLKFTFVFFLFCDY